MPLPFIARALLGLALAMGSALVHAEKITVAAAADLKFALSDIRDAYLKSHPGDEIGLIFGSSGNFTSQIRNGAPYDLFFSADIAYPARLASEGLTASAVTPYAVGRIVLWQIGAGKALELADLARPAIRKLAIANPKHAPYGARAQEALKKAGVWDAVEAKLVLGENIAQTAQFVESGAADAGIVALSLVESPALKGKGRYTLIPESLHTPLQQGYVTTIRGRDKPLAAAFARYVLAPGSVAILKRYGFTLPDTR